MGFVWSEWMDLTEERHQVWDVRTCVLGRAPWLATRPTTPCQRPNDLHSLVEKMINIRLSVCNLWWRPQRIHPTLCGCIFFHMSVSYTATTRYSAVTQIPVDNTENNTSILWLTIWTQIPIMVETCESKTHTLRPRVRAFGWCLTGTWSR